MRMSVAAALLLSLAWPGVARAYCLSTTCKETDACDGEDVPGCIPLKWKSRCVGFSVHELGGPNIDAGEVDTIVELAFDAWRKVDCGDGEPPGVVIQNLGEVECGAVEYNKHAGNANVVLFNSEWPHSEETHTFALTTTTFDPETGELLNADIELNARDHTFTVSDESIDADLLSILTHEVGHFLGIGHSQSTDATMFEFYAEGTTELRSLTDDDRNAMCTLYSPKSVDEGCNPLQRHGFSPYCRDEQPEGSCAAAPQSGGRAGWMVLCAMLVGARRSRKRS
jgi:Matrixin